MHPKLVHLPIGLAVLMPLIAIGLVVAWRQNLLPRRTWLLAVLLQGILVVSGFVAMRSGEGDEERVEKIVAESVIETHEEAAEVFVWTAAAVFALALGAAFLRQERLAMGLAALAGLATLIVLFLGYRTGEAGGALVYRHGAAAAYATAAPSGAPAAPAPAAKGEESEEDDD